MAAWVPNISGTRRMLPALRIDVDVAEEFRVCVLGIAGPLPGLRSAWSFHALSLASSSGLATTGGGVGVPRPGPRPAGCGTAAGEAGTDCCAMATGKAGSTVIRANMKAVRIVRSIFRYPLHGRVAEVLYAQTVSKSAPQERSYS